MTARKYRRGKQITSMGGFEQSTCTFFVIRFGKDERTRHRSFVESWQYHTLQMFIRHGDVFEAERIEEETA